MYKRIYFVNYSTEIQLLCKLVCRKYELHLQNRFELQEQKQEENFNGFQPGAILSFKDYLTMSRNIFGHHNLAGGRFTGNQWAEARDATKILQCSGQPFTTKNYQTKMSVVLGLKIPVEWQSVAGKSMSTLYEIVHHPNS